MSLPEDALASAGSLCAGQSFGDLVAEGDRLQQQWYDHMQRTGQRAGDRGDQGYRVMNRVAESLDVRGWSHYILWYCDPGGWTAEADEHVRAITEDDRQLWRQWQSWPGPMVGPGVKERFEIADAFGYVLDGRLVSAAQVEASSREFAWEYGVDTLPEFRGRGFATAVLNRVTSLIMERGRIAWHYCDHYNRPSRRLPEKLGCYRYGEGLFGAS